MHKNLIDVDLDGDGAVLGRIFAHLHSRTQIDAFLSAVQEVRAARVQHVVRASLGNIFAVALPPGIAEAHDRALRERAERGIAGLGLDGKAPTSEEMIQVGGSLRLGEVEADVLIGD